MKFLSLETREWHTRKCNSLSKARIKAANRRAQKKKRGNSSHPHIPALRILAPKIFNLYDHRTRAELANFLLELRTGFKQLAGQNAQALLIDFSRTTNFSAGGTLLFYAELTRLIDLFNRSVKIRCTTPQNNRASQVLEQIGVYNICSHRSHGAPTLDDVVHWRVARGHLVDNRICAPAIEAFEGQLAMPLVNGLLGGLAEAMTNAVQHAYDGVRQDGLGHTDIRDWWMFSQAKDGFLYVVFCDLGVGIPTTLPVKRAWLIRQMEKLGIAINDANCIAEAINEGRSKTGLPGRGHGLGNIIEVVENVPNAHAVIMSNRGRYDSGNDNPETSNYVDSILGTLIYWKVPLQEEKSGEV